MSEYKVSARKYRPQRFDEVISQEFVTQTLRNSIINNKTAHSYLFSGPRGIGKTTIARILAKAMNCLKPENGEPCNKCESCLEITRGGHPDVFELDAASNRGIDDVRAIQDASKVFPMKAKRKFFIVDEVHMLTLQAFNALLKILEEPPEYLIFVLATTNPEKVPATISSRCQRFSLRRLTIPEISSKIKEVSQNEKINIDEESLFTISKLGEGSLRDALGIFDMAVSFCSNEIKAKELKEFLNLPDKEIYFNVSRFIKEGNSKEILIFFDNLNKQGFDMQTFYNGIIEHLRNLLIYKTTNDESLIEESDYIRKKYKTESGNFTEPQILRLMKIMMESEGRFKYSQNQKLMLEAILVELCRINNDVVDLSVLISELEALKKKSPELNNTYPDSERNSKNNNIEPKSTDDNKGSEIIKKIKDLFDAEEWKGNE